MFLFVDCLFLTAYSFKGLKATLHAYKKLFGAISNENVNSEWQVMGKL